MKERTSGRERGQATVEFAIVLPLVLLLIAGVIEFGKAFNYWLSLNHLANEAARLTAVNKVPQPPNASPDNCDIRAYLLTQISGQELYQQVAADKAITLSRSGAQIGDEATVQIQTPYSFPIVSGVANLASGLFGGSSSFGDITLTGKSTVRLEQVPTDWTPGAIAVGSGPGECP